MQETRYEALITGLLEDNFATDDFFLSKDLLAGLRNNLLAHYKAGNMHAAGIGRLATHHQNTKVRGDLIKWIENDSADPYERQLLDQVQGFIAYLNQTCYTSINDIEFHYAYYEQGSFYKRHLDQFKSHTGRKFSFVIYLNESWQAEDGGAISLYLPAGTEKQLLPLGGRAVLFKADELEHEVHVSPTRARLSIAGWLKVV